MAGICRLQTVPRSVACRLGLLQLTRSYGAAALQMDYDYYYEDEEDVSERVQPPLRLEPSGSEPGRGVQWVVMGYPGVEKQVYTERLSKLLEVPHISMGSLVRQHLSPRSSLYKQIAKVMNEGRLLPEDIIFGLLSKRLEEGYYRGETGFILDGIPRTRIQAEILDQIADIDLVVNFKCKEEYLKKHLGSGVCQHCGSSTSSFSSDPSSLDPCSPSQSHHTQLNLSAGNAENALEEKLNIYAEQSKVLEDHYRKRNKLVDFHVAGGTGETWRGLLAALHLQHMDTASSSQKLTA